MSGPRACVRNYCGRPFPPRTPAEELALLQGRNRPAFADRYCPACLVDRARTAPAPIVEQRS